MDGNTNNTQFPDSNASTCHVEKPKIYVSDFDNGMIWLIEFQTTVLRLVVTVELFEWGVSPCPSSLKWIVEEMNDKFSVPRSPFLNSLSLPQKYRSTYEGSSPFQIFGEGLDFVPT